MSIADDKTYLKPLADELTKPWPTNRRMNLVFHGHSVPAGYFKTPLVDTFHAYPHQMHQRLKERFPFAVLNAIVTAIGGEESEQGAARFESEVLAHQPDLVLIDYSLNDRRIGLERARAAWLSMVTAAKKRKVRVLLLTPTLDTGDLVDLARHATQVRQLAATAEVGLVDSFARWEKEIAAGTKRASLLSQSNHPNAQGHQLVTEEILRWFPA